MLTAVSGLKCCPNIPLIFVVLKLSILHVGRCGLRFNKVCVPYLRYYIFCCHFFCCFFVVVLCFEA